MDYHQKANEEVYAREIVQDVSEQNGIMEFQGISKSEVIGEHNEMIFDDYDG